MMSTTDKQDQDKVNKISRRKTGYRKKDHLIVTSYLRQQPVVGWAESHAPQERPPIPTP